MTWSMKLIYSLQIRCCNPHSTIVSGKSLTHVGGLPERRLKDLASLCTDKTNLLKSLLKQMGKSGCSRQQWEWEWVTNSSMKWVRKEIRDNGLKWGAPKQTSIHETAPGMTCSVITACLRCRLEHPGHPKPFSLYPSFNHSWKTSVWTSRKSIKGGEAKRQDGIIRTGKFYCKDVWV